MISLKKLLRYFNLFKYLWEIDGTIWEIHDWNGYKFGSQDGLGFKIVAITLATLASHLRLARVEFSAIAVTYEIKRSDDV